MIPVANGAGRTAQDCARTDPPMATGTVKFFNADKGYGFIKPDDGSNDIFVHVTAVQNSGLATLNENDRVSFDMEPDRRGKGPKAINLALAE